MSTITLEQQAAIAAKLASMTLPSGLGDEESACSIAAINLALSGRLTDDIPDCMSKVIGRWIIKVQDSMPADMRNSERWKQLLPLAAGTGRDKEKKRLAIILDWMWGTVLPTLQPHADANGFGAEWQTMTKKRTEAAARADAAAEAAAREAAYAAAAARADAVWAAAAMEAAWAAAYAAAAAEADVWQTFDPCGLLERLIDVK
ncbi:MAG: hypothetical protein AN487_20430 [Anabaena sp. CRKS33]|nr:MAG: hypothetical protein AN487_20430 [Anabaena sp. CRKS33]